ncbi:unnamed protein product [Medioppia subpectinata]|uniref:Uncharacterized protein n=1 Tax=Medioppia subpectinata TaxID=1979941 RepID=A0A7R9QHZ8_9ACAR|nr:unnamed protein product [Medioppia subpectinata]CAG2120976.1 unnamed protein product [Medioppia subpectinata]
MACALPRRPSMRTNGSFTRIGVSTRTICSLPRTR